MISKVTIYSLVLFSQFCPVSCSGFGSNCCFLTSIQVSQETGEVVWYSHLLKNFPQLVVIHIVKGFSIVSEAEVDVVLALPCLFHDRMNVGILIFGSSASSKPSLYIWKFFVDVLLKPSLEDFEYYLATMWNECNCVVVWTFFGIAFLWDWNENWIFQSCGHCWVFKFAGILSATLSQHHLLGFEIAELKFHHLH